MAFTSYDDINHKCLAYIVKTDAHIHKWMDGRVVMALASGASGATRVSSILTPFTYLFFFVLYLFIIFFIISPFTSSPPLFPFGN